MSTSSLFYSSGVLEHLLLDAHVGLYEGIAIEMAKTLLPMVSCAASVWETSISRKRRITVIAASCLQRVAWQTWNDLTDEIA
jgi:hypothetical protein